MRLFGKSRTPAIEPAWSYSVKGVIWRIHPAAGRTLIGEERRINEKKAHFFCLDRTNGQEFWQYQSPGDDWWIGIEAVCRDTVLFHGFATPSLPRHRGIIAVDLFTGKKLWEDRDLEFIGTGDGSVVGSKETSSGHAFVALDGRSGAKRGELDAAGLRAMNLERDSVEGDIKFPVPLELFAEGAPGVEAAFKGHCSAGAAAGPVEVVEQEGFLIFDYHESSGQGTAEAPLFSTVLKVIERSTGAVVYEDTVSTGVHAVIPELFFVQHEMLYYIRECRTLMAIRLAL